MSRYYRKVSMKSIVVFIGLFLATSMLQAAPIVKGIDAVSVSYGQSKDNINVYRLSVRDSFNQEWAKSNIGYFDGYFELSANYFEKDSDSNFGIALSPVFTYNFTLGKLQPYIEGGIGVSLWSDTMIAGRNLSSKFLFEDRIGLGLKYENYDFSFRYMHYSNAGIVQPNSGIDIFIASITYKF